MEPLDHLDHLRRELDLFAACLTGDLSAPVEHCGSWTLYRLADHLGRSSLWSAAAVGAATVPAYPTDRAPNEPAELSAWFADAADTLVGTLDTDRDTPAWTFHPPATVAFWQRRRCHETMVHRFDAQHAIGAPSVFDAELAGDGVAEVVDTMVPFQLAQGRLDALPHALRLTASDLGRSWTLGPGEPVAEISAPAADLLLLLWHRRTAEHPTIGWAGDRSAAAAVLAAPLVP